MPIAIDCVIMLLCCSAKNSLKSTARDALCRANKIVPCTGGASGAVSPEEDMRPSEEILCLSKYCTGGTRGGK